MNKSLWSFLICFLFVSMLGCAANKSLYEEPAQDVGVLSEEKDQKVKIEEVSEEELANIKPGQRPPIETDEAGLWMIMDQAEEKLKTSGYVVQNKDLNDYLKSIVHRLVPQYSQDIRIYLVRIPHFNASMAPNGAMQIWTGLLLRVQNEAQLAAVIAHEIGHYLRRHSLQRMQEVVEKSNMLAFVQLATAVTEVSRYNQLLKYLALGKIQSFSRNQEREADGYSIALMSRAGYDPREASKVWSWIIEEEKAAEDQKHPSIFFATHPPSEERYKALARLSQKIVTQGGDFEVDKKRFLKHVLSQRSQYLEDELHLRRFNRTEKLLKMLLEQGQNPEELYFFLGEMYRLRGQPGDMEKALQEYEKAVRISHPPPQTYRSMGLVYNKLGRKEQAIRAFRNYLQNNPQSSDRKIILQIIKNLQNDY